MLRQRSRPYLFSNSLAPSLVGAAIKVIDLLSASTELRDKLERNTDHFRAKMTEVGFDIKPNPRYCSRNVVRCQIISSDGRQVVRRRNLCNRLLLSCGSERTGKNTCANFSCTRAKTLGQSHCRIYKGW